MQCDDCKNEAVIEAVTFGCNCKWCEYTHRIEFRAMDSIIYKMDEEDDVELAPGGEYCIDCAIETYSDIPDLVHKLRHIKETGKLPIKPEVDIFEVTK